MAEGRVWIRWYVIRFGEAHTCHQQNLHRTIYRFPEFWENICLRFRNEFERIRASRPEEEDYGPLLVTG